MCKFCESLKDYNELDALDKKVSVYRVALQIQSLKQYKNHSRGGLTDYGYELNFCPECGRKLDDLR